MFTLENSADSLKLTTDSKKDIIISPLTKEISIDGMEMNFPGEYEKSGILVEVKQYSSELFYSIRIGRKNIVVVYTDSFELKEEILTFFGDVDFLFITGTKDAIKIYENIEARVVIPMGEGKDIFLQNLGQSQLEGVKKYKAKIDSLTDSTEFVNLI